VVVLTAGGKAAAIGQDLAEIFEADDPVAQQAPALLGVARDHARRVAISRVGRGTRREVPAHRLLRSVAWSVLELFDVGVVKAPAPEVSARRREKVIAIGSDLWVMHPDQSRCARDSQYM
jgi:hypothetical protein